MNIDLANVYTANFGRGNYEWDLCLERNTVATMIHAETKPFYDSGNREEFIDWCIANRKAASGLTPTRAVASRWYSAMETVEHTNNDIWIHRAGDYLYWTTSNNEKPIWEKKPSQDPAQKGNMTYVCHKPCNKWSSKNIKGSPLLWKNMHPKAIYFLSFRCTLMKLSDDNASYVKALLAGDDLSEWESRAEWKEYLQRSKVKQGQIFNDWENTVWNMVYTVKNTVANSNGQSVERTIKNKNLLMDDKELEKYINQLAEEQDGRCAITDIPLQCLGSAENKEMIYSLDRIDSNGHYEKGNLQLVCRFINRWKSDSNDSQFRGLINIVKGAV